MILCADDYGYRDDVNRAILELAGAGRLSAVSCMTALERCGAEDLKQLNGWSAKLDVGLHLCLTDEKLPWSGALAGATLPSFGQLLRRSLLGLAGAKRMEALVRTQYEGFIEKSGRRPDYIDGHLHAHQLPGVAEGLARFVESLPADQRPYVRNTRMSLAQLRRKGLPWGKSLLIGSFGARLARRLRAKALPTNDSFSGIYDFKHWQDYAHYFPRFVSCITTTNGILVVHPGQEENWRRSEYETIRQFRFAPGALSRFQR